MNHPEIRVGEQAARGHGLFVAFAATTAFAALTALGARVQFHLPFTPVPITAQVFCVLLAGGALGGRLGFVSQAEYLAAGVVGLPVFAQGGGPQYLLGPTGGYLLGFPFAAFTVGAVCGLLGRRGVGPFLAALCGVVVIHLLGACWYVVWSRAVGGEGSLPMALAQAVYPFVGVDLVKASLAAALFPRLRRRLPVA